MNLTFKRDTLEVINNTELTENMLSFCTNANYIFFDCRNSQGVLTRIHMGGEYSNVIDSDTLYNYYYKQDDIGSDTLTNKRIVNYHYLNNNIGSANLTSFSNGTLSNACNFLEEHTKGELELIWTNPNPSQSVDTMTINFNKSYQGYVLTFRDTTTGNNYLPVIIFTLPPSVATEMHRDVTNDDDIYRIITLNPTNKTLTIGKATYRTSYETTYYPDNIIPTEVYGWGL